MTTIDDGWNATEPVGGVATSTSARLSATGVACWFGEKKVLEGVDLEMAPGQVTALIGPSGCGKSTFLRTLNRMHELVPSSATLAGQVRARRGGHLPRPVAPGHRRAIRSRIGMVFQKPNPFPAKSIWQDNVAYGPQARRDEEVRL